MKVKILDGVRIHDRAASAGEIVDLPVFDARYLISCGRAEKYVVPAPEVKQEARQDVAAPVADKTSKKTEIKK